MNFREACKRLENGGLNVAVAMKQDRPVEILFLSFGRWTTYCGIDENENIDEDAREDIEELY